MPRVDSRSARLMTGTMRPASVCAAKPRLTKRWTTISLASTSRRLFTSGNSRRPATQARMMRASGLTLTRDCEALSSWRRSQSFVASASTQVVASGISLRETVICLAIALRMPLRGRRSTRSSLGAAGVADTAAGWAGGCGVSVACAARAVPVP